MDDCRLAGVVVLAALSAACLPLDNEFGGGGTDLNGTVEGVPFDYVSGSAERTEEGYVVSLTDADAFGCNSFEAPPLDYVLISISNIEAAPTTFDAAGNVFFNSFVDGVSAGDVATSGTVTIDELSTFDGVLRGSIDASNDTSDIFGTFDVEICL